MKRRKNGEGSYGEKTIKGVLYYYYKDADGKYTYGRTTKELNTKLKIKKEEKKLEEERKPNNNKFVFTDYCNIWLKYKYSQKEITDGVYDDYESIIENRIEKFKDYNIGGKQIKSLTSDMFNSYFEAMGEVYSKGSIDKTWTVIRQVLDYGIEKGDIPHINISSIKRPREADVAVKKKEIPFITMSDMDILYNEMSRKTGRGSNLYGDASKVVIFIMYSGLRISEAIGLKWRYVSEDFSSIKVVQTRRKVVVRDKTTLEAARDKKGNKIYKDIQKEPKSKDGIRAIPLPKRAIDILKYFYNLYPHGLDDFVFLTSNQTPFGKRGVERTLERMLNRSECACKEYTPHALRHGYGSVLISKGVDIKIVSELLGHSDVAFTYNVYIGILKEDKINAVNSVFNVTEDDI